MSKAAEEFQQATQHLVSAVERRFGFRRDRSGDAKLEAGAEYICPVCHCPREEHGCTTSTSFKVEDPWPGSRERRSRVHLSLWCRHPDTFEAVASARRYHEIEPPPEESPCP